DGHASLRGGRPAAVPARNPRRPDPGHRPDARLTAGAPDPRLPALPGAPLQHDRQDRERQPVRLRDPVADRHTDSRAPHKKNPISTLGGATGASPAGSIPVPSEAVAGEPFSGSARAGGLSRRRAFASDTLAKGGGEHVLSRGGLREALVDEIAAA